MGVIRPSAWGKSLNRGDERLRERSRVPLQQLFAISSGAYDHNGATTPVVLLEMRTAGRLIANVHAILAVLQHYCPTYLQGSANHRRIVQG